MTPVSNSQSATAAGLTMVSKSVPRYVLVHWLLPWLYLLLSGLICAPGYADQASANNSTPSSNTRPQYLRFGATPFTGAAEARRDWQPLIDDLARTTEQPVRGLWVSTYDALELAVQQQKVDLAFLSGKMALDAMEKSNMLPIAQVTRPDGLPGIQSLLITHVDSVVTRENMLRQPGRWVIARGSELSMSGYIVPQIQLFLPQSINSAHYFKREIVAPHQESTLAVINGAADMALVNTADLEHFRNRFPQEHEQIRMLWSSTYIPHALILVHKQVSKAKRDAIARFFLQYARAEGKSAAEFTRERQVLEQLHGFSGFVPVEKKQLAEFSGIQYELARRSALLSPWVSKAALDLRLKRLQENHESLLKLIRETP